MKNLLARITDTGRHGLYRFVCRTVRPDFNAGLDYVAAEGMGQDAEEAILDLRMAVAGDDFETVSVRII